MYLETLNTIVKTLLKDINVKETIQILKMKIREAGEPFIWSLINIDSFQQNLPSNIKSIWIFVLKKILLLLLIIIQIVFNIL